jgi:hypothetical protein
MAIIPMFTLGIVSGSVLLTWLYRGSGGSAFVVALWHACYNLVSGTAAAGGLLAAIVSTGVMVWATVIVVAEVRRGRRERGAKSKVMPAAVQVVTDSRGRFHGRATGTALAGLGATGGGTECTSSR